MEVFELKQKTPSKPKYLIFHCSGSRCTSAVQRGDSWLC